MYIRGVGGSGFPGHMKFFLVHGIRGSSIPFPIHACFVPEGRLIIAQRFIAGSIKRENLIVVPEGWLNRRVTPLPNVQSSLRDFANVLLTITQH